MTMEVEIISREIIKPSTPTPPHLRTHNLSFIEQNTPRTYLPVVYFYHKESSASPNGDHESNQLKKSLSEILSKYYPFAGRIRDRASVDCNDEGVAFVEARVRNVKLSEILEHPEDTWLDLLFTDNLQWNDDSSLSVIFAVQVSFFDCGGMAIGICMSHKVADTSTVANFINDWAARNKCDQYVPSPLFIGADTFPQGDMPLFPETVLEKGDCITKRFVFDALKIASLKALVADKVQNPTRVEVVTALIYSCAISALRSTSQSSLNPTVFIHTVNLRTRVVPPLPKNSVGSMIWAFTLSTAEDSVMELHDRCSSWCRFPVYEADFGWGKPIWVTIASCPLKNAIFLIDTRNGEGIEAYVNLEKQQLDVFERDAQLLAFASLNPSALDSTRKYARALLRDLNAPTSSLFSQSTP